MIHAIGIGPALITVVRTTIVLAAVVIGIRAFGARQAGEMNLLDVLLIFLIANGVQSAMTRSDGHLLVSLGAASALILAGRAITSMARRWPRVEHAVSGTPVVLIHNGQLLQENLRREGITKREVEASVRKQGLANLKRVKLAVLEIDGSISVVPESQSGEHRGGRS